ncbi:MAG: MBL fold metallo-hydrolase [Dactylosporangium sp.]|nr:MBL fold metallo-hydrolase [Dactylosporangium sp.]NNJ60754.1 MBL fold metallo-hydrolase [Dactylosporangium sp.]
MTYTGQVVRGGPADVRTLPALTIGKLAVGGLGNNAYLLRCPATGRQVLVDAAADAGGLLAMIGAGGLAAVVTTHRHDDHWQALAEIARATGAACLAHEADAPGITGITATLREGDRVPVGDAELEVIHLRGHTPGSIALLYQDPGGIAHLFTGDALFPGGVGATRGNAKNFRSLIDDVEHKIFDRLPDDTWFYPGHGDDSTLGAERPALPEWRVRGW